jgi:DNA replication protein DnaC
VTEELSEAARAARDEYVQRQENRCLQLFPRRYAGAVATNPGVIAWCDAYTAAVVEHDLPPERWSLVLTGPFGTGKTWQAYGAVRRIATAPAGIRVAWQAIGLPDLLAALRPREGSDPEAEYDRYAGADLLLVDDLGAHKPTDWSEMTLDRLVNHRSMHQLPTIWTTNLPKQPRDGDKNPPPTLLSELPGRVYSRLLESRFVAVKGDDRRAGR